MNLHLVVDLSSFQPLASPFLQGLDCRVMHLLNQPGDAAGPAGAADQWALVDFTLPWQRGLALIQRLGEVHPNVGIIVTNAKRGIREGVEAYNLGVDVFRNEALMGEELLAVAAALLKRLTRRVNPLAMEPGQRFFLDTARQELHGPTSLVRLAASHCKLLQAFCQASGMTLTRSDINKVFGYSQDSLTNVAVPVGRLRQKLMEAGAKSKPIISLRGNGYRLVCPVQVS